MKGAQVSFRRLDLTPDDQHIFEMFTEERQQVRYRWADELAFVRARAALQVFGSVREVVAVMETAARYSEARR